MIQQDGILPKPVFRPESLKALRQRAARKPDRPPNVSTMTVGRMVLHDYWSDFKS